MGFLDDLLNNLNPQVPTFTVDSKMDKFNSQVADKTAIDYNKQDSLNDYKKQLELNSPVSEITQGKGNSFKAPLPIEEKIQDIADSIYDSNAQIPAQEEDISQEDKEEALPEQGTLPLSKKDAAAIKSIPGSEIQPKIQTEKTAPEVSDFLKQLKEAQAQSKQDTASLNLAKAFDQIAQANARQGTSAVNLSGYEGLEEAAKRPVVDLMQQIKGRQEEAQTRALEYKTASEQEMRDPNSNASIGVRDTISRLFGMMNQPVPAGLSKMSGAQLESIYGKVGLDKMVTHYNDAMLRQAARAEQKETKRAQQIEKQVIDANKLITAEIARSNTAFGQMAQKQVAAQAINKLTEGRPLKDLDSREIYEIAKSLDQLLSMRGSTISGTMHLLPQSAMGSLAKATEWLTNNPVSPQMDEFVRKNLKTVKRENELAMEQEKKTAAKLLSGYAHLQNEAPAAWKLMMIQHGLPENPFPSLGDSQNKATSAFPKLVFKDGKQATIKNEKDLKDAISKGWKE